MSANDDEEFDDPTFWGGAELGAPKPSPTTRRARREEHRDTKRDLAKKAKTVIANLKPPAWAASPPAAPKGAIDAQVTVADVDELARDGSDVARTE